MDRIAEAKKKLYDDLYHATQKLLEENSVDLVIDSIEHAKTVINNTLSVYPNGCNLISKQDIDNVRTDVVAYLDAIVFGLKFREIVIIDKETGEILE